MKLKSISFHNVSFGYNARKRIFNNLAFTFQCSSDNNGFVIAMMGASGSGKTTLLKLILGLLKPTSGKIEIAPNDPVVSYVPQEGILFDHLSPLENARYFSRIKSYKNRFDEKSYDTLKKILGMSDVLQNAKSNDELSGGEKQRLSLLRALSIKPDVLLLDEPTTGLDADVKLQFLQQLRESITAQNTMVIYVTHHKSEAEFIADEIAYLNEKNAEGNDKIHQGDVSLFIKYPPTVEAAKVFNYPAPNVLGCTISKEGYIIPVSNKMDIRVFLSVPPTTISFSDETGFNFRLISSNPLYSFVEIEGGEFLTIYTPKNKDELKSKLNITGTILQYSINHQFVGTLKVDKNRIVAEIISH